MGRTTIEWTDFSVNPIRARLGERKGHYCEKVSPGCKNCYSSALQRRFGMPPFQEQRGAAEPFLDVGKLEEVLRRRKPTRYFWCDMTDMFGGWVPNEWIAACFGVMAATPHHTHQVLTKRPKRMREWFEWLDTVAGDHGYARVAYCLRSESEVSGKMPRVDETNRLRIQFDEWPLPNVWLGVSAEDQQRADERIPDLLATPAAVRFVSAEPLLGPVRLPWCWCVRCGVEPERHAETHLHCHDDLQVRKLDWVIVGSESGPRGRPMATEWAASLRDQCAAARVAFFTKQIATPWGLLCGDRKGTSPRFWPEGDWPRQFPGA